MRRAAVLLLLLGFAASASAAPSHYCAGGRLDRPVIRRDGLVKAVASLRMPDGFDPTLGETVVTLAYEPETEPANAVIRQLLPPDGWKRTRWGSAGGAIRPGCDAW